MRASPKSLASPQSRKRWRTRWVALILFILSTVAVTLVAAQISPGGIALLPDGKVEVGPNPVTSPREAWKVYRDPFYNYSVAYPPEWFLTAPPPDALERAREAGAQIVLGLNASISSADSSRGPEFEAELANKHEFLGINISVDDEPLKSDELLKDWLVRRQDVLLSPDQIKSLEETEHKGHPALFIIYSFQGMGGKDVTGLLILIAAKDLRVFRVGVSPEPQNTIYSDTFNQILDSFTILE